MNFLASVVLVRRWYALLDEDVDVDLGQHPSLKKYYDAVETLPELGDVKEAGKEYFMKAPETFLGFFRLSFKEHVEKVWRHQRIVVFTIGDNPVLAQEFLKLLNHIYHGNDKDSHHWPPSNKNITLKSITIKVRCLGKCTWFPWVYHRCGRSWQGIIQPVCF